MLSFLRGAYGRALTPLARFLARLGVGPTAVTVVGTAGVVGVSLWFLPRGEFLVGALLGMLFLLGDGLDGTLARLTGRETRFGAFLDSTLDRLADAALFTGVALWAAPRDPWLLAAALGALVLGTLVSYARARAEAEGWDASVGLFERTDRVVLALAGLLAVGLDAPTVVLTIACGVVALGSAVTVGQRVRAAHSASLDGPRPGSLTP